MSLFLNKTLVKKGCWNGFLIAVLIGLAESFLIHLKNHSSGSFLEWMLFYLTSLGLYGALGILGGTATAIFTGGLGAVYENVFKSKPGDKLQFLILTGVLLGTILALYLRLYYFLTLGLQLTLLLLAVSIIIVFLLNRYLVCRLIPQWIKAGENINVARIAGIFILLVMTGWIFLYFILKPRDIPFLNTVAEEKQEQPNILLITIDTLRADQIGVYGYKKIKTPVIDGLADRGTVFTQHICQQTLTTPSHASLLSSTYPISNGVEKNSLPLDDDEITLAEILRDHGYFNAAFVSAFPLNAYNTKLDQGFHYYDDKIFFIDNLPGMVPKYLAGLTVIRNFVLHLKVMGYVERRADETNGAALKWLKGVGNQKFFLWVHYFDPHYPYVPPPPHDRIYDPDYTGTIDGKMNTIFDIWNKEIIPSDEDIHHMISLYDGEISFTDEQIGVLMKKLEEMHLLDNTIIIVTADHGESLWEHDYNFKHGDFVYDTTLRVPLIIVLPGEQGVRKKIDRQTENIDIVPTILEVLGIQQPSAMQGESLLGIIRGQENYNKKAGFSQAIGSKDERYEKETKKYSIRTVDWKYIQNEAGEDELYHIKEDPAELSNQIASEVIIAEEFKRILDNKLSSIKKSDREIAPLDEDTLQRLKSLGYIN